MTAAGSGRLRVILADDHPIFLAGVMALVQDSEDIEVVASASTGGQALKLISAHAPDIAVIDIAMPERSGIEVLRRMQKDGSPTRVVIVSSFEERVYIQQALEAGARGYVLKRASADHLVHALRAVHDGGTYLDPLVLANYLHGDGAQTSAHTPTDGTKSPLSERETEVLKLVAFGHTIKEIAARLGISSKSIETHKMRAIEKLDLHSRAQIVEYAILRDWLSSVPDRSAT